MRYLPLMVAILAVLGAGLVHGYWTDRWGQADAPALSASRLESVSSTLGDWQGEPLDKAPRQPEPIYGYLYRRYVNQKTGVTVVATLVCGRPGPVSIHTPDICYSASGYDVEPQSRFELPQQGDAPPAAFWTSNLKKIKATSQTHLRIFWSWSADGQWQIAENPRLEFAHHPVLYKLYVIREMSNPKEPLDEDPCLDLMKVLLPELKQKVFSSQ